MIQEHFEGMKIKLNYMKHKNYLRLACLDRTLSYYEDSAEKGELIVRLAVKQTMVLNEKKEKIKKQVISMLKGLIDAERFILNDFLKEAYIVYGD